jgi:predicted amidohydrolase YtcJ
MFFIMAGLVAQGILYSNAHIHTQDPARPRASALAVLGGRVVWLGEDAQEFAAGKDWPRMDLGGAFVVPGLCDAHGHVMGLGASLRDLNLVGTKSYEEVIAAVATRAKKLPPGSWIVGRGWDQNDWADQAFPTHRALSQAVPNHPVFLSRVDGHAALVNRSAMEAARLDSRASDPPGGHLHRDENGLTGVLVDAAMDLVRPPAPTRQEMRELLLAGMQACAAAGLTAVHDAGVSSAMLSVYEELAQAGQMPIRVYAMLENSPQTLAAELPKGLRLGLGSGFLTVRSIKAYMDGALGSRGALLLHPYHDAPQTRGLQLMAQEDLARLLETAMRAGFQVNTHAIGDGANHLLLQQIGQSWERLGRPGNLRFRVEHAQILAAADMPLFTRYGIIPSMQPTHCSSDMPWAPDRLGPQRIQGAYAWRSLRELGLPLALGSDFPVEDVSPLLGIYAAITSKDRSGNPPEGFRPDQVLSREEALLGFTKWAAYAAFQEDVLGALAPGMLADFTVVDRDLLTAPAESILQTRILMTVVDGVIRHRQP